MIGQVSSPQWLPDVISGMFLVADPDFNVGDWIEWPGGEGTIEAVDFRVTRIRTPNHETISIPNTELTTNAISWSLWLCPSPPSSARARRPNGACTPQFWSNRSCRCAGTQYLSRRLAEREASGPVRHGERGSGRRAAVRTWPALALSRFASPGDGGSRSRRRGPETMTPRTTDTTSDPRSTAARKCGTARRRVESIGDER
jgi:hypothetical protein